MAEQATTKTAGAKSKGLSPRRQVFIRFFRSKLSIVGIVVLIALFLFCFIGPLFSPWGETQPDDSGGQASYLEKAFTIKDADGNEYLMYDVTVDELTLNAKAKPSWSHLLGTDEKAMDVLMRLMCGGRVSLLIAFLIVLIGTAIGILLGGLAGYFGGFVDQLVMRIVDVFSCIPTLPILLITSFLLTSLEVPDDSRIIYLMLILTVFSWQGTARMVRGQFLLLREQDYMVAAESLGFSAARKIFKHLLPNVFPQLIVSMTLGLGGIILYESTLSFLGLGIPYPQASWGTMIGRAVNDTEILANNFNIWVPPGICIVLAVLAFNFIGDGLRDAFDPKGKR